ncbi:MAG: PAS domain S-box protein, partial [Lentimicrobium sp.]|nr:PAS domain S-box protein [Lentimicrobium sp.]
WQHIANTYSGIGLLPADYSPEGFIYEPVDKTNTLLTRGLVVLAIVVVLTSVLAFYISRVNRRLAQSISKASIAVHALEKSEELWRTIVKASPDGVAITSPDGIIEQISDKGLLMLGFSSSDEIIGKNIYEFIDPKYHELANSRIKDVVEERFSGASEYLVTRKDGSQFYIESNVALLRDKEGNIAKLIHNVRDITQRRKMQDAIEKRIVALTLPIAEKTAISFEELFNLEDIQLIQDDFAAATGVASLITRPDGTPITKPSNFTRFCSGIVRQTEKGCFNCRKSDLALGVPDIQGPKVKPCLSGGLWDAGAGITIEGQHIANWLVGQVRDETQTEESIRAYAKEIGADEEELLTAFFEVPPMSEERFTKVAQSLYTLANQLSVSAYQNVQQARFISEIKSAEDALKNSESKFRALFTQMSEGFALHEMVYDSAQKAIDYRIIDTNSSFEKHLGISANQAKGMLASQFYGVNPAPYLDIYADIALNGGYHSFQTYFPPLNKHFEISAFSPNPGFFATVFADISERKQSELALSKSEELFRTLVNSMDELVYSLDTEQKHTGIYGNWIDNTELSVDSFIGKTARDIFGAEAAVVHQNANELALSGKSTVYEWSVMGKSGIEYYQTFVSPIMNADGIVTGLVGVGHNISDKKLIENTQAFLLECGSPASGSNFFEALAPYLAETLNMDYVCIDRLEGDGLTAQTVAVYNDGKLEHNVRYTLKETPCGEVVNKGICYFPRDVQKLFPQDEALQELNAESYIGTTLLDSRGVPIGLIAIIGHQVLFDSKKAEVLLKLVSLRASGELERLQAEEALRVSEEMLAQSQQIAHVGSWKLDILNNNLIWSDETYRIFGFEPGKFKGTYNDFLQAVHPDDREAVHEKYISSFEDGKDGYETEHRILLKQTGEIRYVYEKCIHERDEHGKIIRSVGMVQDITDRKVAEANLRETRDYLENLLNYANAPIIVWDNNLKITQFNKAFERLTGLTADEVSGREVSVLFPDSTREKSLGYIQQASSGDRWEVVEIDIKHKDGSIRTLLWNSAGISSPDGKIIVATIAQGQDITERKLAEFNLKSSEERFRLLLNSSAEGIYGIDNEGNCTFCNQSALRILGYGNIDEVLGKNMHDLIHHSHSDGTHFIVDECQIFKAFLEGKETHAEDEVLWTKQGDSFPAEYWSYPIFSEGSIIGSVVTFFDITERKKAAQALFDSERQKATLISNLPGFVYRCANDKEWTIQYISDGCKAITGYEPGDFMQNNKLSYNDLMKPEYREPIWQNWQNLLKEKKSFTGEYPIINASGETRWVWEQGQGIFADDGVLLYLEGFITDITEQKVIQEAIRESEEKLSAIIATSPDGIAITSLDGTIQSVSPQIASMWHLDSADEMIGRNIMEFLHPDYHDKAVYYITEMLKGNLTGANEYLMIRKDSSSFFIEANANILRNSANEPIGILYIERDITERKIAEQILKESEEQHRLLFETAREGIFVAQGEKLSYFNPMIPEISGYSSEELSEISFIDFVYPDDRELVSTNYKKRLKGEFEDKRYSFRILRKDDHLRWVEISGVKIDWKGKPATLNFINDIHDHKLAEEALRESEARLRELNATKDKFFSIIAHDLKSPFNNILALSNLLVDQINNNEKEGVDEYAWLIQQSSQRAMDLLLNLLEWSRSQTGRMEFSPEYVELTSMINEVAELANDAARLKSITISKLLPHNALVMADKAMLGTVLRNLISNAIKFTRPGGAIEIEVKAHKKELLVIVSDNGLGIKSEALKKLFRIEESFTTKGTQNETGTGLGLLLCKEFVQKHSGEIWVESELGKGSKFYFTIPKS